MKKLIALLIVALSFVCTPRAQPLYQLIGYIPDATYVVYARGYTFSPYAYRVDNGDDTVLTTKISSAGEVYEGTQCVLGETVSFCGAQADLDELIERLGFSVVYDSDIAGCTYGYSPKLGKGVLVEGRQVNCQIVIEGDRITVGFPLILGSYHLTT